MRIDKDVFLRLRLVEPKIVDGVEDLESQVAVHIGLFNVSNKEPHERLAERVAGRSVVEQLRRASEGHLGIN